MISTLPNQQTQQQQNIQLPSHSLSTPTPFSSNPQSNCNSTIANNEKNSEEKDKQNQRRSQRQRGEEKEKQEKMETEYGHGKENIGEVRKICQGCGVCDELFRCSGCKGIYYCGRQCQKKDWKNHKKDCKSSIQLSQSIPQPQTQQKPQQQTPSSNFKPPKQQLGLSQFPKLTLIGTGNFSQIYSTRSKLTGLPYAIKQVQKSKVQRMRKQADIFMQKHCLNKLKQCPYVVKLYKTFQDQISLYFQMEMPENGELWEKGKIFGIQDQDVYRYWIGSVVQAVSELHNKYNIVHRDLKPENILIDKNNNIKLIDFGTAKDLDRPDIKGAGNGLKGKKQFQHYVGTAHYMAPQCIHNKASQKKSDIYSLSGILYFMKIGSPPFQGGSEYLTFTKSLQTQLFACPQLFDQNLRDLIKKMNHKDMNKRIDINQVKSHPYFKDFNFQSPSYPSTSPSSSSPSLTSHLNSLIQTLKPLLESQKQPPLARRLEIYNQSIKPILTQYLSNFPQSIKIQEKQQQYRTRVKIIDIQCQSYLNIRDNSDMGFFEIYQQIINGKSDKMKQNEQEKEQEKVRNESNQQQKEEEESSDKDNIEKEQQKIVEKQEQNKKAAK